MLGLSKGQSFTVVKRSKPIFQLNPINDEGRWHTIVDLTEVDNNGVDADELLSVLC